MTMLSASGASFDLQRPSSAARPHAPTRRQLGQCWIQAALGFCASTTLMVVVLATVVG